MFSEKKIRERVARRRKRFLAALISYVSFIVASVAVLIITDNVTAVFIATLVILISVYMLLKCIGRSKPTVLFSREVRGVNIKEHEFVMNSRAPYSRYFGFYKTKNAWRANAVHSAVYIRLDDGNVMRLDGIFKAHTDIYVEGDELVRYAGCRYPVVVGRFCNRVICPICGTINSSFAERCISCKLEANDKAEN